MLCRALGSCAEHLQLELLAGSSCPAMPVEHAESSPAPLLPGSSSPPSKLPPLQPGHTQGTSLLHSHLGAQRFALALHTLLLGHCGPCGTQSWRMAAQGTSPMACDRPLSLLGSSRALSGTAEWLPHYPVLARTKAFVNPSWKCFLILWEKSEKASCVTEKRREGNVECPSL